MCESHAIVSTLIEEGTAARAHFQTWWALRNLALPEFYETMNHPSYVEFFKASNSGHYKLFFLALSKIFDRDPRVSGVANLREVLRTENRDDLADALTETLVRWTSTVARIMAIRNTSIAHNERGISRERVYGLNGVTPDQIRELIDETCWAINRVANGLGISNVIFNGDRFEDATIEMLKVLRNGQI
ncbi:MAG: hypothetical protein JWO28_63 [Hyphomicrobiales bacterium]|nr:hypothetical protein [Hyphomicrobiales bacterium]